MKPHLCFESTSCTCNVVGLEPDEACPVHGAGEWPPRCFRCGRFMCREEPDYEGWLEITTMRDPSPIGM